MKIESTIRRKNGTVVTLDDHRYHFQPSATDPRHLADVEVKAHIARFLSIPEGYQIPDGEAPADPIDPPAPITGTLAGVQDPDGIVRTLDQLEEVELRALAIELEIDGARDLTKEQLVTAIQAEEVEIEGIDTSKPAEQKTETDEEAAQRAADEAARLQAEEDARKQAELDKTGEAKKDATGGELDRDALVKLYEQKFGKKPHRSLKAERIKQLLEESESE